MGKRSSIGLVFKVVFVATAILLMGFVVVRKIQRYNLEQQVMAILVNEDRMARIEAFARFRETHNPEIVSILVQDLDDPDPKIHSRAVSGLALFHDSVGEVAPALIAHLNTSRYSDVRLGSAIMLMWVKTPAVHAAYLHALHDSADKVVEIACVEVAAKSSSNADVAALYAILDHPTWNVRLEVCKALITMKKADKRVVSTLEVMSQDSDAARYDRQIEDFERIDKEMGDSGETAKHWGKLATILQRARDIAAKG